MDTAAWVWKSGWTDWFVTWLVVLVDVFACSKNVGSYCRRFELCGDLPRLWTYCTI